MNKYMIMFTGGVETQEYFSVQMSETFEREGYEVYWFDLNICGYSAAMLREYVESIRRADEGCVINAFTFNFSGIAGEDGLYGDTCLWDDYGILVCNMVVDHPLYYHQYIPMLPHKYIQLDIDYNHIVYMNRYFPGIRCEFVPLGGTEVNAGGRYLSNERYIPIKDRPIDVIFTGNYTPITHFDRFIEGMEKEYQDVYRELVSDAINNPDELIETLLENKFRAQNPTDEELKGIMPNMMFVDLSVRFYYRAKVIALLADSGIKVHTYGAGWDLLECKHKENIISAGNVGSQECLDMISQSKISVNVMPWFKNGAHDRVFNTMLNGAVCVTDKSEYLCGNFNDNSDVIFYSLSDIAPMCDRLKILINDKDKLQSVADAGYEACVGRHTWEKRAGQIVRIIQGVQLES